jgi:hypothetical protein
LLHTAEQLVVFDLVTFPAYVEGLKHQTAHALEVWRATQDPSHCPVYVTPGAQLSAARVAAPWSVVAGVYAALQS